MNRPIQRVLLVDDNEDDYVIVRDLLDDITDVRVEIEWVTTYEEAQAALQQGQHDVCLLDYRLGGHTGLELLEELPSSNRIPIILLTGNEDHKIDVAATKAGASDYLVKGHINTPLLERAIRYAIEHKRTTEALRFSEERYRAFIGNSTEAIWCCELGQPISVNLPEDEQIELFYEHSYLSECNEAMASLYGFSNPKEIIGATLDSLLVRSKPENIAYLRSFIRSCYRLSDAESCEIDRYGNPKYFLNNLVGVVENGVIHRVWGTQRDVTERRESEIMRAQLAAIVESSEDAIISKNLQGIITTWNSAAEKLYGFTSAEAIGQSILIIVPPGSLSYESQLLDRSHSGEPLTLYETIRVHKNGSTLNVSLSIAPIKDLHGNIVGDSSIERDISERKRNEAALQQSNNLLNAVIEGTTDAIFAKDLTGRYLMINTAGADFLNRKVDEIIGKTDAELIPLETARIFAANDDLIAQSGLIQTHEESGYIGDVKHTYLATKGPLLGSNGEVRGIVGISRDITARKQAEEALRKSELELRELTHQLEEERARLVSAQSVAKVGSWETDLSSGQVLWSNETYRIFEIDSSQFEQTHIDFLKYVHPEDQAMVNDAFILSQRSSSLNAIEHRIVMQDGRTKFVEERWQIERDEQEKPLRALGTVQDISERKEAESLLRKSQQRLALATESAHVGIWDWNVVNNELVWDKQMFAIYGIQEEDFNGAYDAWKKSLHPDDRGQAEADMQAALEGTREFHPQFRVVWPNGEVRHIEAHAVVIRDRSGSAQHVIGVNWDVTERKESDERLRISNERFEILSRATNDAVWDLNLPEGNLWWNEGFEALFGYNREQIAPHLESWSSRIHPDDAEKTLWNVQAAIDNCQQFYTGEYRFRRSDGSYAYIYDRGFIIYDADNHPIRMVGSMQDITERKQSEETLRASEERFQSIVANVPGMVYQFARHPDNSIEWPFVSDGCQKMFEVEPETIKANPSIPLEMIHPEDRSGLDSSMTASETSLTPWSWEGRLRTPSGKTRWIQGASFPQRMKSGGTLCTGLLMDITARKEAEAERDRFFMMSLDMLCIAGFDGYLKRINPAFTEILGYSENELLSRPFLDMVHPDDQASTRKAVEDLSGGSAIIGFENRYLCADGSWRWLEWKSVSSIEEGVIYAAARDVTGRKDSEAALLQMRDELEVRVAERTVQLAKSNEALQIQIKVGEDAEAEIRARARQQETVAELGRRALTDVDMSTLLDGATALVAATLDAEISSIVELLPRGAGLRFCAATGWDAPESINIVSDENYSQAAYALASNTPTIVSDLRSETRFEPSPLLLNAGVVSSVTVIIGGYAQPFGTLAAHTKQYRIFSRDDVHFLEAMANVLAAAIERRSIETEIRQLNEQLEESNELLRIENIERQMALNALRESAEVLESAKEEAEAARENAEVANRAKSEFLSRMSHELRTPLNAVIGFGQILAMNCREEESQQKDNIQQILKAGRHLLDLINEVLDIARIEAGHLSLSQEPIPVYELAREVLHLVRPLAAAREIFLINEMPAEYSASYVLADQQRFKQVLLNFLSNAVKYNRHGGQVSVGCEIVDGPPTIHNGFKCEGNLRLLVKDTGNGLTAEEMTRLFVPFERLGASRTQIEGSGIGLSLCKQLIEAMNGQVGVESQIGQGSTFWLQLPMVKGDEVGLSFDTVELNPHLVLETSVFHDRSTILYIEDNLSNIKLIENLISGFGPRIRLLTAMQGSLGIDLAEQHQPNLILLDVNLPDMPGGVVLDQLKANPLTQDIPVVVLSADATSNQRERMLTAGASHYLTKPLDIEQFWNVIGKIVQSEKVAEN